jgi:hypothetical protein
VSARSSDELSVDMHIDEQLSDPHVYGNDVDSDLPTPPVQQSVQLESGGPDVPPYSLRPRVTSPSNAVPAAAVEEPRSEARRCRKSTAIKKNGN